MWSISSNQITSSVTTWRNLEYIRSSSCRTILLQNWDLKGLGDLLLVSTISHCWVCGRLALIQFTSLVIYQSFEVGLWRCVAFQTSPLKTWWVVVNCNSVILTVHPVRSSDHSPLFCICEYRGLLMLVKCGLVMLTFHPTRIRVCSLFCLFTR
jgi:hypothetical protein